MVDPMAFGYGDLQFEWGDHICTIFENREQQMSVMVPFMAQGIAAEQRCIWVSQPSSADLFRRRLADAGADVATLEASDQLLILPATDYYLTDGIFDADRTLELALTVYEDSIRAGYAGIRATGDVSWLSERPVELEAWERYESEFGSTMAGKPGVVVCQYDARRFSGAYIVAALHTHPIVILGETVCRNPFFSREEHYPTEERQVH
ncbi:MAG: MEDS domain-containing protein [Armatimonadetes bacterium]|nr:MEDS domain-containing protein [Armatimonadota bacterium]